MGVQDLWSILGPVQESVPLYSLTGKTLAVDLSLWICEAQHVQAMMGKVTKPHLRNLFFRVSFLTLMGIKLLFVMEGEAPKLKAETMSKRTESRFGGFKKAAPKLTKTIKSTGRGRFKAILRECAEMLDYLGVPWVTAAGEAEAMCAYLDAQGLVDGCITNDGDAFLYGAKTVYRNFNMNTKDPLVDCYRTSRVQSELHLSRENLIGLAILLGCDYIPKGIPGVGKEQALKLIQALEGQTLLQRFRQWQEKDPRVPEVAMKKVLHCQLCHHPGSAKAHERGGCVLCDSLRFCQPRDFDYQCPCDWHSTEQIRRANSLEANIRKKTLASEHFPFAEIVKEFLISKDKPVPTFRRRKPNMLSMQNFAYEKMEWPKHYTSEKVLVLMTYTELMNRICRREASSQITPLRILKPRVRNAVASLEVIWSTPEHYVFPEDQAVESHGEVRTVEEEALFCLAYPDVVERYRRDKALAEETKTKKKKGKHIKEKPFNVCDGVTELLAQMNLQVSKESNPDTPEDMGPPKMIHKHEPETTSVDASAPQRQPLEPGEDCHPGDQSEGCPLPRSDASSSPSVSAIIDRMHLSDIDWDASSFTSSPPPRPAPDVAVPEAAPSAAAGAGVAEDEAGGVERRFAAQEFCFAECSLRDRVLMRNMAATVSNQTETHDDPVTKRLLYQSHSQGPVWDRVSREIPMKAANGTRSSEKRNTFDGKKTECGQKGSNKVNLAHDITKQTLEPLAQVQGKTKDCVLGIQKSLKHELVKAALSSAPIVPRRCHSDPSRRDGDRKLPLRTKGSVCAGVCSSSEDSDAENQPIGIQRNAKIKSKSFKNVTLKPTSRTTKAPANTVHLSVPKVQASCRPASTRGECLDVPQASVHNGVLFPPPSSPVKVFDSDDSVTESPLPLAERVRLKYLM